VQLFAKTLVIPVFLFFFSIVSRVYYYFFFLDARVVYLILLLFAGLLVRSIFRSLLGIGLRLTPLGDTTRLIARRVAVRLQIVDSRHVLIDTAGPRSFFVSTSFLALLGDDFGLLARLVALLQSQRARSHITLGIAIGPLTLDVPAGRRITARASATTAGCTFFGATNCPYENFLVVFLPQFGFCARSAYYHWQGDTHY